MNIRDGHALINGSEETFDAPSNSISIIGENGRALFGIALNKDGSIRVDGGDYCKHGDRVLGIVIEIEPCASNCVIIRKRLG